MGFYDPEVDKLEKARIAMLENECAARERAIKNLLNLMLDEADQLTDDEAKVVLSDLKQRRLSWWKRMWKCITGAKK
jgi:uncharacterized coiled-coil protein SlyX